MIGVSSDGAATHRSQSAVIGLCRDPVKPMVVMPIDLADRSPASTFGEVPDVENAMTVAFEDHRRAIREKHRDTFFTPHAADNEPEFFADATEAFYCRPLDLRDMYRDVYELLAAYYRVDPATWQGGS